MRNLEPFDPTRTGLVRHDPTKQIPFQSRIECQYFLDVFGLMDIPPWGIIVPIIGALDHPIFYFFVVETLGMPKDTVMGIRWTPRSGNNVHALTHVLPGDGEITTRLQIPKPWILECEDQDVLIECEVSYPDGSTETGSSYEIHVSQHVYSNGVDIGGMQNGDNLEPSLYPDGIPIRINPVTGVERYQRVTFSWQVIGIALNGSGILLYDHLERWDAVPGEAYEFLIPPEGYNGFGGPNFTRLRITAVAMIHVAPWPTPQFGIVLGGANLNLPIITGK